MALLMKKERNALSNLSHMYENGIRHTNYDSTMVNILNLELMIWYKYRVSVEYELFAAMIPMLF